MLNELNTFWFELFNCVFVGKNFLVGIFGRFVGFERVCFIQHIFFRDKRKNTKFFAEREGQKKRRGGKIN